MTAVIVDREDRMNNLLSCSPGFGPVHAGTAAGIAFHRVG